MSNNTAHQPTSWRDVYQLVQDVEARLTSRLDSIGIAQDRRNNDHELRIRKLEIEGSDEAKEALLLAKEAASKADTAKQIADAFTNREQGVFGTLGIQQKVLVTIFGALGALAILIDIVNRLSPQ